MSILVANLVSFAVLLLFISSRWRRTRSLIEPGVVFAANLIVLYPIRGFVLFFLGDEVINDNWNVSIDANLEFSSWLAVLGCIGYVLGYSKIVGRRKLTILNGSASSVQRSDDVLVVFVFFLASLIGIAYKIATGDYISYLIGENRNDGLSQGIAMLTGFQWPAYIGAWVLWFRGFRTSNFIVLFVAIQAIIVPFQFIQGSKTFLSLLLVSIILAYFWGRGKLPKVLAMVAATAIVIFVFPFVHNFREFVNNEYGQIPSISSLDITGAFTFDGHSSDPSAQQEGGLLAVSARYNGIDELYGITQTVPDFLPYKYGSDYSAMIVNLVPRAVWPDKPIFSRGAEYGASLGTITSVTPYPFGEAYWDMGVFGVFVMMIVWGGCLAGLLRGYENLYRRPGLSFFIGTYFLSQIYWIAGSESSMPAILAGLTQQILLLSVLYYLLRTFRRSMDKVRRQHGPASYQ